MARACALGIHLVYKTVDTCAAGVRSPNLYHQGSELDPAAE